ncbi:MAG: tetratricopeptide repeat protein [Acidobacteria bacterium]|nr:tetratricopeptide repeat protein [Acidobacteriota bacterium]
MRQLLLALGLGIAASCASVPPAVSLVAAYPDLPRLTLPDSLITSAEVRGRHEAAWRELQAGDLKAAGRAYEEALRGDVAFFPAEVGLAYVASLERRYEEAARRFDAAIGADQTYLPALLGRMDVALVTGDDVSALATSELILASDPTREDVRGQQDVLRLRVIQAQLARAASARSNGEWDQAQVALDQALVMAPDSAVVLREVALVEIARGAFDAAEAHARRSLDLDAGDAETHAVLATVLEAHGRLRDAAEAFARAAALDPRPEWRERAATLRARVEFEALPEEYRAIPSASHVTRGQLAAALGIRLQPALARAPRRVTVVLTDVQAHWAAAWILPVTRVGWMESFANHTFQPSADVRRSDLALAVWRVVQDLAADQPQDLARWQAAQLDVPDVSQTHLAYRAIAGALASGVMGLGDRDRFQPNRQAAGADVIAAVARLEQLSGRRVRQ